MLELSGAFHTHLHHHPPGGGGQLRPGLPQVRRLAVFRDSGYGHRDGSVSVPGLQRSQAAVGGVGVSWHVPFGRCRLHLLPALPLGACSHEAFLPAECVQQHWVTLLLRLLAALALLVTAGLQRLLWAASRRFPRARGKRQRCPHDDNRTARRESLRSRWGGSVFPCVCLLLPLGRYKQKQKKREKEKKRRRRSRRLRRREKQACSGSITPCDPRGRVSLCSAAHFPPWSSPVCLCGCLTRCDAARRQESQPEGAGLLQRLSMVLKAADVQHQHERVSLLYRKWDQRQWSSSGGCSVTGSVGARCEPVILTARVKGFKLYCRAWMREKHPECICSHLTPSDQLTMW